MDNKIQKIVHLGTEKLQGSNRVQLPGPVLKNLDLQHKQKIEFYLNTATWEVILKPVKRSGNNNDKAKKNK